MLSDDPVLRDFFRSPSFGDISGPWRPGSIRDQAVRACLVIERAIQRGWISHERPLAVVGAGIAGITAAVLARREKIPVTIYESEKPMAVLSRSFRWVDPVAYDWPHAWWAEGRFPQSAERWPIQIEAGEARTVAIQFADLLQQDPEIQLIIRTIDDLEDLIDKQTFVLDCRGVKSERTRSGRFEGLPFWDRRDPLLVAAVAAVAAKIGARPRVLISGGGDGAIQDFLLLATGVKSIIELAQAVGLSTSPSPGSKTDLAAFERAALSIEERCWRELCWADPRDQVKEQQIGQQLDQFYRHWADELALRRLPRNPAQCEFTLVRRCESHSTCYPLNRLLAILAEQEFHVTPHLGELDSMALSPDDFDMVSIRHGIEASSAPGRTVRRQALPFTFS